MVHLGLSYGKQVHIIVMPLQVDVIVMPLHISSVKGEAGPGHILMCS